MLTEEFLRYLKYERAYSQKTIEAYSNDLKEFRSFFEERIDSVFAPETVDADIVRQWEVYLLEHERMSARSVNRKLSALKSFFRYLLKSKKIASKSCAMKHASSCIFLGINADTRDEAQAAYKQACVAGVKQFCK